MPNTALKAVTSSASTEDTQGLLECYERAARYGNQGLWDWDLVSGAVWYSPSFKALLGYETGDPFPNTFAALRDRLTPEHNAMALHSVRRHLEQHHPLNFECQMRTRSGELRWFNLSGAAQRDSAGRPLRLSGVLHDVTEQRRTEAAVRHAEDLQRQALDALQVAVGVLDGTGRIVEINRFWREFPTDDGLFGLRYNFGEDYALLCQKAVERCAEGAIAAQGIREVLEGQRASFSLTYRVAAKDGERYYELRAQPFIDHGVRGAFVIHVDVSATRRAYAALEDSRDFYERILNAIPIQISYVDRNEHMLYMNRAYEQWLQLPLSTVKGRPLQEVTSPQRYRQMAPRIQAALSGRDVEFEESAVRVDGVKREMTVGYIAHRNARNDVEGFLSIVQDVTERKRLEASLRQSQKLEAMGQLTGGIAHDFNNLLSVIVGNLQLLERPLKDHSRLLKQVQTALRAALRGADLTRRLLAFARQTALEPRQVAINELIHGMQELLGRSLGRQVEIRSELIEDAWSVRIDPSQLENCLLNLAINARDAMPDGGTLTLRTENVVLGAQNSHAELQPGQLPMGDYLRVTVTDTGSGMLPEVLKRAFEPFFTTKEVGKGTGLGLSMVYGFMEQSGGLATLASKPGLGTTVSLYFPRVTGSPAVMGEADTAGLPVVGGSETILVVEDDADVRATAVGALRSFGYQVLEAEVAMDAMKILESNPQIDLLFSDVTLPGGIHGPALSNRARKLYPSLKVLFTSGFSESAAVHRGLLDGTLPLIAKPYAISDLARRVRDTLDND